VDGQPVLQALDSAAFAPSKTDHRGQFRRISIEVLKPRLIGRQDGAGENHVGIGQRRIERGATAAHRRVEPSPAEHDLRNGMTAGYGREGVRDWRVAAKFEEQLFLALRLPPQIRKRQAETFTCLSSIGCRHT
jgi:hypothetical protein